MQAELAQFPNNAPVAPASVLLRQADDDLAHVACDLRSADTLWLAPFPHFHDPARIRLRCDDADDVGDVVIEFPADGQQPGPVLGAGDDTVPAQFAAEDLDLSPQEPYAGIATGGERFNEEMTDHVEPAQHGDRIPNEQPMKAQLSGARHSEPPPKRGQPAAVPGCWLVTARKSWRTHPLTRATGAVDLLPICN